MMPLFLEMNWIMFLPYLVLAGGALLLMFLGLLFRSREESPFLFSSLAGISVAACMISIPAVGELGSPFGGLLAHDDLGNKFAQVVLMLLLFSLPALSFRRPLLRERPSSVLSLLLLSASGGLMMVFANHFISFFVGLELLSLPLYVLTALGHDRDRGGEAAFKYFLLGAISSAIFVYGAALVWGGIGTLTFSEIGMSLREHGLTSPGLFTVGLALVVAGVGFKLGLVPFQMWLPDVYEGAPSVVVAWMSGAVKAAAAVIFFRLFRELDGGTLMSLAGALSLAALLSMFWGSLGALYQKNVKRLFGYSTIAHVGYLFIAFVVATHEPSVDVVGAVAFYVLAYGVATLAGFVILSVEEEEGRLKISDLSGLFRRKPVLAIVLAISLLSLAGLPPLGGFMAKFNIFLAAIRLELYGLVLAGVVTSAISLGFYLRVLTSVFMKEPEHRDLIRVRWGVGTALGVATALILFLGLFPQRFLDFFM